MTNHTSVNYYDYWLEREDQHTKNVERLSKRITLTIQAVFDRELSNGASWEGAQMAALDAGDTEVSDFIKLGVRSTPEFNNLVRKISKHLFRCWDRQREQDKADFEKLVEAYTAADKIRVEHRVVLAVKFSEAFSEDPSSVLGHLIDDLGLEYLGGHQDVAIFEEVSEEFLPEVRNIIGVLKASVESKRKFISVNDGPWRMVEHEEEYEKTLPPKAIGLPYEDYYSICTKHGVPPVGRRDHWKGVFKHSNQLEQLNKQQARFKLLNAG